MADKLYKLIEDLHAATILIVSQSKSTASITKTLLKRNHYTDIKVTDDPYSVVSYYENEDIDLIILDIKLHGMDGFGVIQILKESAQDRGGKKAIPPILVLTTVDDQKYRRRALDEGANDYVNIPFDRPEFLARTKNLLEMWQSKKIIQHQNETLEYKVSQRTRELQLAKEGLHESRLEVVLRLGRAAEYRDNETGMHIIRMSRIAALLAREAGLSEDDVDLVLNASPMHDIGKLGIPDRILLKPGKLDSEEWEIMKTHAQIGADILSGSKSPLLEMAHDIALMHHEKYDGTGYPNNIKGKDIPISSRLTTVADVFDALTSVRPYKQAWSYEDTMAYFHSESGKQFDPELVGLLEKKLPEVIRIKQEFSDPE